MLSSLMQEQLKEIIEKYNFQLFPISSMKENGICSCKKINCTSPGKHPIFKGSWKKYSSSSVDKISLWLSESYNLAVRTGLYNSEHEKYLVVVDIDNPNHELIKILPKTFYYRTGSGGYHYWYFSDKPIKNSVSIVDKKIDIRGSGGYVIIPPSRHKKGKYEFLEDSFNEIIDLPKDLLIHKPIEKQNQEDIKTNSQYKIDKRISVQEIRKQLSNGMKIVSGKRNDTIFRLLCSDRARGADQNILEKNMIIYSSFLEEPESFSEYESNCILKSVLKYSPNNSTYNTNESYVNWLEKTNKDVIEDLNLKNLEEQDKLFFSSLKPDNTSLVSIKDIMTYREAWYQKQGIKFYSKYKMQFFAKELEKYNFIKKRTSKNNVWNVNLDWSKV